MEIKVGSAMRSKISLANLSEKSGSGAGGGDALRVQASQTPDRNGGQSIVTTDLSTNTSRLKCRCAHSKTAIDVSIER